MGMLLYLFTEKLQTLRGIAAPSGRKSLRKLNANDKRKKKPTWRNTLRYSTTSAYSLTGLPAGRVTLYLVIRRLSLNYSAGPRSTSPRPYLRYLPILPRRLENASGCDQRLWGLFCGDQFIVSLVGVDERDEHGHPVGVGNQPASHRLFEPSDKVILEGPFDQATTDGASFGQTLGVVQRYRVRPEVTGKTIQCVTLRRANGDGAHLR
jgi:hypothetical protein